jgi:L-ascorbate metabolism protein UlaG (beta-lactamase superfamily)
VLLELGGVRLLTDPALRPAVAYLRRHAAAPEVPDRLDAILLSHLHHDHLDLASLRLLPRNIRTLVPAGAATLLRKARFTEITELEPGESTEVSGTRIEATPAEHDGRRVLSSVRVKPMGFVVRGERPVYFAGDTDLFDGMDQLRPLDVTLLPVAGWGPKLGPGHMNAERAARAAELLRPRTAVPIHWGTFHPRWMAPGAWFSDPPKEFAAQVAELAPEVDVRILSPGESLEL